MTVTDDAGDITSGPVKDLSSGHRSRHWLDAGAGRRWNYLVAALGLILCLVFNEKSPFRSGFLAALIAVSLLRFLQSFLDPRNPLARL